MRMMMPTMVALMLTATPAAADVSGRYETVDEDRMIDMEMTLEVDDAGNARIQMAGSNGYYLLHGGELFMVSWQAGETTVVRMADAMVVAQEVMARLGVPDDFGDGPTPEPFMFEPMGEVEVRGRTGTAYGIASEAEADPVFGSLVISNDPRLAPLGRAQSEAQRLQAQGMGSIGMVLQRLGGNMQEVMASGAMLRWLGIELTDVSFDPIPPERLALPGEPVTLAELREAVRPAPPPPTLPPRGE